MHFAEINQNHHETIRKNILENGLDISRTKIFGGNLFQNVDEKYDFILSNPPYINPDLNHRVERSVVEFEPEEALYGGSKGLEVIKEIVVAAPEYLKKLGILYIEHEPEQQEALSKYSLYKGSHKDQFGVTRFSKFTSGQED